VGVTRAKCWAMWVAPLLARRFIPFVMAFIRSGRLEKEEV